MLCCYARYPSRLKLVITHNAGTEVADVCAHSCCGQVSQCCDTGCCTSNSMRPPQLTDRDHVYLQFEDLSEPAYEHEQVHCITSVLGKTSAAVCIFSMCTWLTCLWPLRRREFFLRLFLKISTLPLRNCSCSPHRLFVSVSNRSVSCMQIGSRSSPL